jgi:hypothetical protein
VRAHTPAFWGRATAFVAPRFISIEQHLLLFWAAAQRLASASARVPRAVQHASPAAPLATTDALAMADEPNGHAQQQL